MALPEEWEKHKQSITVSVGFIWAGSSVPQRDILQHCRDAEKVAKKRGRDRVTIRVVFNSGQYVQWTCPWHYLCILQKYQDRDGKKFGDNPNWAHIYSDWAYLQGRHSIPQANARKHHENYKDGRLGLNLFDIYFPRDDKNKQKYSDFLSEKAQEIVGGTSDEEIINWIDGLIKVAWQLYSNIEQ
jgi:CRISPR-associated protein Cmr2